MIKTFKEYIDENLFAPAFDRSRTGDLRREDGRRVETCLGVDVVLKNPNYDYDHLIKSILSNEDYLQPDIDKLKNCRLSPEEKAILRKGEAPYGYLLTNYQSGEDIVIQFDSYSEVNDYTLDQFSEEISEEDYISICRCIATKLKEVGDYFEYVPQRNDSWIILNRKEQKTDWARNIAGYEQEYVLCLISENKVYNWICDDNEDREDYSLEFREDMIFNFPELRYEDFIAWTYRGYGINIALPLSKDSVINFQKYKEFTINWFGC